ncbi:MAG: HDIG domain-containing metalloprotein [Bacteroidota bacterium]
MKNLINWIVNNFERIYIFILFLISFLIVAFLFPGEGNFRYEFQKGKPWLHEDLVAPFDFAIHKLDDDLLSERDAVNKNFKPYFNYNEQIGTRRIEEFKKEFDKKWELYLSDKKEARNDPVLRKNLITFNADSVHMLYDFTNKLIAGIYKNGILEFEEDYGYENQAPFAIEVIKDKIVHEIEYNKAFTLKSAYTFIINSLNEHKVEGHLNHSIEFIENLHLNKFIEPNLFFNKETSEKVKNEELNSISLTSGIVHEGERIIYKGEVVDEDRFRILESLKKAYLSSLQITANRSLLIFGRLIIVFFVFLIMYLFLLRFRSNVLNSRRKAFFILLMMVSTVAVSKVVHDINELNIYIIPFVILPLLINTFYDSRLAIFTHFVTILIVGFFAPNSFEFVLLQFIAGIVAIMGLKKIQKRSHFLNSALLAVLSYFFIYFGVSIYQEGNIKSIEWINFAWFAGNGVLLLLSYPLVYVFERIFKFLSDITLLELADTNQRLLRQLAEKAPGTFQHSMQVANLAEEVIREIGGNPLLVRTGALYHDIGKLHNPHFFTENQISGNNPHDEMSYLESAETIINHVVTGEEMAKKAKLPEQIIDFIVTHHGTTKTQYFYRLYKKEKPDDKEIDDKFSYPGPKPFSKETAILMMADSLEAASRSLKSYTEEALNELTSNIVDNQMKEKQFDNANITLHEIAEAKRIFLAKLQNIYHARIEYPKEN